MRLLLIILFASTLLMADGLGFNKTRTHLAGSYTTLQLTGTQKLEVERTRIVTLTDSQLQTLRQIGESCPGQLEVLTSRYDSCSCGMEAIAVWFAPGRLEVPHRFIPTPAFRDGPDPSIPFSGLVIDPDGVLWLFGKPLPLKKETEAMISVAEIHRQRFQIPTDRPGYCHIETPPEGAIRNRKAIEITLRRVKAKAKNLPLMFSAPGFFDSPSGPNEPRP